MPTLHHRQQAAPRCVKRGPYRAPVHSSRSSKQHHPPYRDSPLKFCHEASMQVSEQSLQVPPAMNAQHHNGAASMVHLSFSPDRSDPPGAKAQLYTDHLPPVECSHRNPQGIVASQMTREPSPCTHLKNAGSPGNSSHLHKVARGNEEN